MSDEPDDKGDLADQALVARELRRHRERAGLTLNELATRVGYSRTYISTSEKPGAGLVSAAVVKRIDEELGAGGVLIALHTRADVDRKARRTTIATDSVVALHAETAKGSSGAPSDGTIRTDELLSRSVCESETLLAMTSDAFDFEILREAVAQLGANYVGNPPLSMLREGVAVRRELLHRKNGAMLRPNQLADLYVTIGRASGIIAYAALDIDSPASAALHGATAWRMAEVADNDELRAWARGTQSLIARFNQEFTRARLFAHDGLRFARGAVSRSRLTCAAAQCAANQGDVASTFELINEAERITEASDYHGDDKNDGIFGFPLARQKFYFASSLIWMDDKRSLMAAVKNAAEALDIWQHTPGKKNILDDEALAHVYLATAHIKLDEINGAMEAIAPVLELPLERRTSWMRRRVANLRELITGERFKDSVSASAAGQKMYEFETSVDGGGA